MAQAPVFEEVGLDITNERRVGHHAGAEERQPPGQGQHPVRQGHRTHVDMALDETHRVPLAHPAATFDFAEFVGGQTADIRQHGKQFDRALDAAGQHHGVAVDHPDHRVFHRHLPGQRTEGMGQAIALAGAASADDHQLDVVAVLDLVAHDVLDEGLVAFLDDRGNHRARHLEPLHLLEHRLVDLERGQGRDAEAGDHHEHVRRQRRIAQAIDLAAQARELPVQEVHAAQVVEDGIAIAPQAQRADDEDEQVMVRVQVLRRDHLRRQRDQAGQARPGKEAGARAQIAWCHEGLLLSIHVAFTPVFGGPRARSPSAQTVASGTLRGAAAVTSRCRGAGYRWCRT
ncbi:hypothetical protein D3C81_664300 [compost metagenome]